MENTTPKNNSAFFTFLYVLSLIALAFTAISSGMILFQIINKYIPEAVEIGNSYRACFDFGALKFAIAAIIVASPIYYIATSRINKHISQGELKKDSQIRKWLTYLIILISFIVIVGNLIAIIYNLLDGELTARFILKLLSMTAISGSILFYYFYDIKREITIGEKNKVIKIYFLTSLAAIIILFISAIAIGEFPSSARNKKYDEAILNRLNKIESAISSYYDLNANRLPEKLEDLLSLSYYNLNSDIKDIGYKITSEKKYELCANFKTSNKNTQGCPYTSLNNAWPHDKGYQCTEKETGEIKFSNPLPIPSE